MKPDRISDGLIWRWSDGWNKWFPIGEALVEAVPDEPVTLAPSHPAHPSNCWCVECWNAGVRMADYLKNRNLWNGGGAVSEPTTLRELQKQREAEREQQFNAALKEWEDAQKSWWDAFRADQKRLEEWSL